MTFNNTLVFIGVMLAAISLNMLSIPPDIWWIWPQWPIVILLVWLAWPRSSHFPLLPTWIIGLIMDLAYNNLLGQNALLLIAIVMLMQQIKRSWYRYSLTNKFILVWLVVASYIVIIVISRASIAQLFGYTSLFILMQALISSLVWLWCYINFIAPNQDS